MEVKQNQEGKVLSDLRREMCVCVCVCVWAGGKGELNRGIVEQLIKSLLNFPI